MLKNTLTILLLLPCFSIAFAQDANTHDANATSAAAPTVNGEVSRAVFTSNIHEREPADTLNETNTKQVYFFTELTNFAGQIITHRWTFLGETMAEINFNVDGDRWRVWSSKQMMPHWLGQWTVEVIAANGSVLTSQTLNYTAAETPSTETSLISPKESD